MENLSLLLILSIIALTSAYDQSVKVKGRFLCRGLPEQFAELQIVDHYVVLSNEVLVRNMFTDPRGFFELTGHTNSRYESNMHLHVWHHCWETAYEPKDPCTRYFKVHIPVTFLSDSVFPTRVWDMGEVELLGWKSGEGYYGDDCNE